MKYLLYILLLTGLFIAHSLHASDKRVRLRVDSIMQQVIRQAAFYEQVVNSYEAEIYVKGTTRVPHKNWLMRYAHLLFPVDPRPTNAFFEMNGHTDYNAPNHYRNKIEAVNGSRISSAKQCREILSFINFNIYSPTIFNKEMIMPLSAKALKYYIFRVEDIDESTGLRIYNIRFTPRQWSQKLLSGNLYITEGSWMIDKIDIEGHASFSEFNLKFCFSRNKKRFALPEKADLKLRYHALGNVIESEYHAAFRYPAVVWVEENSEDVLRKPLDQTRYYKLSKDTIPIIRDTAYWHIRRDEPLTADERLFYIPNPTDTIRQAPDTSLLARSLKLGEQLTSTVHMDYQSTRIKYSGLLNPFELSFGSNGVTYRQQIRVSKTFARDRQLRFHPQIGYLFKKKELRFHVATEWEYLPERLGIVSFTAANDNRSYSSEMINRVNEELKDTTFNFDDLHLKYYRHYYFELRNKIEILNGLQLHASLTYHHRTPVKEKNTVDNHLDAPLYEPYNDFMPSIGLSYTPRYYYWMDGHRKEYLYSHYPTFTTELARGISGIWGSKGDYWRMEAGMHQTVKLGLTERLSYNLSGGLFFRQRSTYFADFRYFAKRYFPEPWGDRFGGVFHNLNGDWYNASDKYIQGHLMYESPFILLRFIKPKTQRYIVSERFYLSQLWTPVLPNYSELGYGVGSDLFNIALFLGFEKYRYKSFGVKFALELFR